MHTSCAQGVGPGARPDAGGGRLAGRIGICYLRRRTLYRTSPGDRNVKVIIPLAGKGTRLRPHTHTTPKPMLRVGGKPVMSYILDDLKDLGVEEIIFVTGYLKENIEKYIARDYPEFKATYVEQPVQNGTAGAVWHAK